HSAGNIERYLTTGITNQWQRVAIPLVNFHVNGSPASLGLLFDSGVSGTVFIDDISMEPDGISTLEGATARALWVWNTDELIDDSDARARFLKSASQWGITD